MTNPEIISCQRCGEIAFYCPPMWGWWVGINTLCPSCNRKHQPDAIDIPCAVAVPDEEC